MRLLVDTHALLWWLGESDRLPVAADRAMSTRDNQVFVSAASIWELSIKVAAGKLQLPQAFWVILRDGSFEELPVAWGHGQRASELPLVHGDPFDRMLVAQAQVEGLTIVTRDRAIAQYDVPTLWE